MEPELRRQQSMAAAHFYSLSSQPEEEALTSALQYAKNNGLTEKTSRLLGRNIYLTDKPEPHGYEYYLAADRTRLIGNASLGEVSGGLYAVVEVKGILSLPEGWKNLLEWAAANGYRAVGVKMGPHGWVNSAYEELLDWTQQKPPEEWHFRLWIQLCE